MTTTKTYLVEMLVNDVDDNSLDSIKKQLVNSCRYLEVIPFKITPTKPRTYIVFRTNTGKRYCIPYQIELELFKWGLGAEGMNKGIKAFFKLADTMGQTLSFSPDDIVHMKFDCCPLNHEHEDSVCEFSDLCVQDTPEKCKWLLSFSDEGGTK